MHVDVEMPAWDERFLADFDPIAMADLYARAGVSSVLFTCKNLSGLCFWPTNVGIQHPRCNGRDLVAESLAAFAERDIATCAYYGTIFDNWAFRHDPDWRFEPMQQASGGADSWMQRFGLCCPNSPGYQEYVRAQIADLFGRYSFDCGFCDMSFWPGICGCKHCRERFRAETGAELPATIDWLSAVWCTFQAARERWIAEFHGLVTDAMRAAQPGIAVYHNFAAGFNWLHGVPFAATEHSDFLGGDLYGDAAEQLVITKLMSNLSRSRPVEYMTYVTAGSSEHVLLKGRERLRSQVLAATAESAAFMFIHDLHPTGKPNKHFYDLVKSSFEPALPFEGCLGGQPVEDVAVYYSDDSQMDFGANGTSVLELSNIEEGNYPHLRALRGACQALQRAHIPFGVITRRQLATLDRYKVLVLPNIARMDADEIGAFREYVRRGGRLYASKYTSLVETRGVRHDDFLLADVFGVHLQGEELGRVVYAKPATPEITDLMLPQDYLGACPGRGLAGGLLRLRTADGATVLATLTLPYAHPHVGSIDDQNWASIFSSPPWEDTEEPSIVEHSFGAGRAVYSGLAFEGEEAAANEHLFAGLISALLGDDWSLHCETHPGVSVSAFRHLDERMLRIALLNSPPALVPAAALRIRPPQGESFTRLEELPSGRPLPFVTECDGTVCCTLQNLPEMSMIAAYWGD